MRFLIFVFTFFLSSNSFAKGLRIISLMPSYTEIIFALGMGADLVGISNYCDYPPATEKIEKVGDYLRPNLEKIYSLKPDIVFVSEWKDSVFLKNLEKLGIKTVQIKNEKSVEDIFRTIEIISFQIKKGEEGLNLIEKMRRKIKSFDENKGKKSLYIEIDRGQWTVGKESFINDIVSRAQGENIFADVTAGYFQVPWEMVVERNPDIVILFRESKSEFLKRPLAKKIKAAKNGKIITDIDIDCLSRPSPRVLDMIDVLRKKFYDKKD